MFFVIGLLLKDSGKNQLELKDVEYTTLSVLVDYMYTGKININYENVYDIYTAADYYLISFVKEMCFDFLQNNLNIDNCVKIWIMASK